MGTTPICGAGRNAVQPLSPRVAPAGSSSLKSSSGSDRGKKRAKRVWESQSEASQGQGSGKLTVSMSGRSSLRTQTQDTAGNTVCLSIGVHVLKKYDVKALIGRGSFSRVLRVESKTTKELYALKIIEKQQIEGNRYKVELSILRQVRHPNVISLYEVFQSNSKVYMVLELATGGDLFDKIYTRGYFKEKQGKKVIRMILNGIAYLHSMGITHRDLKLENLLYKYPGDDSQIMISDFGLAHMRPSGGEEEGMSTTCGTAEYLAPEMLEGEVYTALIDMWSVGVITYVVLSAVMPFTDDSRARVYQKIKMGQYSFTGQVSDKRVCDKLILLHLASKRQEFGVDAITGLAYWTGLLDSTKVPKMPHSVQDRS